VKGGVGHGASLPAQRRAPRTKSGDPTPASRTRPVSHRKAPTPHTGLAGCRSGSGNETLSSPVKESKAILDQAAGEPDLPVATGQVADNSTSRGG
jgi:hypothetical protein